MAVSIKRRVPRHLGYGQSEAHRLARELKGVALQAEWNEDVKGWEFGGEGYCAVGLPYIVVLPLPHANHEGGIAYATLADNSGPVRTAAEVLAELT